MAKYPLGQWSQGENSLGASVHARHIPEGEGGGYYLYDWGYGDSHIILTEMVHGVKRYQLLNGQRPFYVEIDRIAVEPALMQGEALPEQQEAVARLIFADMRKRFRRIAEWIPYDSSGKAVWFHDVVVNGKGRQV